TFYTTISRPSSSTHFPYTTLFRSKIRKEIGRTDKSLQSVGVKDEPLVRPPYGALDKRASHVLGGPAIIWDVDTGDWQHRDTKKRSEEHTSELQSRFDLVCRLLLEK